jgi:hypothetical protein
MGEYVWVLGFSFVAVGFPVCIEFDFHSRCPAYVTLYEKGHDLSSFSPGIHWVDVSGCCNKFRRRFS